MRCVDISFLDLAEEWLNDKRGRIELSSLAKYEEIVFGRLKGSFGRKNIGDITPDDLRRYIRKRRSDQAGMKQDFSVLNMIFCFAVNGRTVDKNPCDQVDIPKKWRKEVAVLRDEDVLRLCEEYQGSVYGAMILFMLYLGLRIGEAIGLTWNRVNWETGTVTICQQVRHFYDPSLGRHVRQFVPYTKTKMNREVKMCEQAQELLQGIRQRTGMESGFIFLNPDGSEIDYNQFYYEFNKIMKGIGREDVTPHGLRHTAATTILYTTKDLLKLRDYLGHRGVQTTRRYPTASEHELNALMEAMDRKFMPLLCQAWGA